MDDATGGSVAFQAVDENGFFVGAQIAVVFDIGVAAAEVKAALVLFQKILLMTLHLPEPPQLRPPECPGFGVVFWVTVLSNMPATLPLLAPTFPAPSPESALLPAIR